MPSPGGDLSVTFLIRYFYTQCICTGGEVGKVPVKDRRSITSTGPSFLHLRDMVEPSTYAAMQQVSAVSQARYALSIL